MFFISMAESPERNLRSSINHESIDIMQHDIENADRKFTFAKLRQGNFPVVHSSDQVIVQLEVRL